MRWDTIMVITILEPQGAAIKKPYQYTPIKIEKPEIVHHPAEV